jgi:hypothetical protein
MAASLLGGWRDGGSLPRRRAGQKTAAPICG